MIKRNKEMLPEFGKKGRLYMLRPPYNNDPLRFPVCSYTPWKTLKCSSCGRVSSWHIKDLEYYCFFCEESFLAPIVKKQSGQKRRI